MASAMISLTYNLVHYTNNIAVGFVCFECCQANWRKRARFVGAGPSSGPNWLPVALHTTSICATTHNSTVRDISKTHAPGEQVFSRSRCAPANFSPIIGRVFWRKHSPRTPQLGAARHVRAQTNANSNCCDRRAQRASGAESISKARCVSSSAGAQERVWRDDGAQCSMSMAGSGASCCCCCKV